MTAPFDPPLSAAGRGVPRPEHPRPQLWRREWLNLNGEWQFEIDRADSGLERGLLGRPLAGSIIVPFAPESALSGIEDTDFMDAVWYRRRLVVPPEWVALRPVLHFGAVDHDTTVWANGVEVVRHRGGFTSFSADLSGVVSAGDEVEITVRARDRRDAVQARGKQATWFGNSHCQYTRTTGIWQTVWLEGVPDDAIRRLQVTPSVADASFDVLVPIARNVPDGRVVAKLTAGGDVVAEAAVASGFDLAPRLRLTVPEGQVRLWAPGDPFLYGLQVELHSPHGTVLDSVQSYTGLRSVAIDGNRLLLNGRPVFQRLVLDQGYWPESLMTAPSDDALQRDIKLSMAAGFNGARLHEKVFEERFLYHADLAGYLVWAEFGDWGVSGQGTVGNNQAPNASFIGQWTEAVLRDVNHPAIVGWCPLNETHQLMHDEITVLDDVTHAMFWATKLADPSRPVIDASGYSHRVAETDVYDSHSYEQDPGVFAEQQAGLAHGVPWVNRSGNVPNRPGMDGTFSLPYAGQPYFVSEFGGIWWNEEEARVAAEERQAVGNDEGISWGYGDRVRSMDEFHERFEGLTGVLLGDPNMFGYCYTQLTDVFQEKNGIYGFDRSPKFDVARLRELQTRRAAFEEETAKAPLPDPLSGSISGGRPLLVRFENEE